MPSLAAPAEHRRLSRPSFRTGTTIAAAKVTAPVEPASQGASNMNRIRLFGLLAAVGAAAVVGKPGGAQTHVEFSLDWKFLGASAPSFLAIDKSTYKAEGLNVTNASRPRPAARGT